MTEERMIRVNIDQWQDMFEGKSLTWNELSMILFGSEFELETPSFYDLEPAPPKGWQERLHNVMPPTDWRPICYDSQYNKLNGCDPLIITNSCAICPFLASRHKTKVTQKSGGLDINLDIK